MKTWPQISIDTEKSLAMCFGCGPDNPIGLKLNFKRDNDRQFFIADEKNYSMVMGGNMARLVSLRIVSYTLANCHNYRT